jgi:membrane associated rhomboid family serine protease
MHLPMPEPVPDTPAQRTADRRRLQRALTASLGFVLLLTVAFAAQQAFDWRALAIAPHSWPGLVGVLTAPLLHGSPEHLGANAVSLLLLGTLAGTVYPRATLRALPVVWIGSGLGAWLLGETGTWHLGASGLTHGLMFLLLTLGLLRRDRPAIAAAMIAFFLYGGMLLTVLPHEPGVSWQAHLGGAVAGILAAWWLRASDPLPPPRRYSWELEAEPAAVADARDDLEPPRPAAVPVLWQRPGPQPVVVRLRDNMNRFINE